MYHYTHAINLLYGLREAIALVVEEGLNNVVQRHIQAREYFEMRLKQMRLAFLVDQSKHRLPGIMSVVIPENIDGAKVMSYLYEKYDILIGGSLLAANLGLPAFWRLGYLGVNANAKQIDKLCEALRETLQQQQTLKSRL